MASFDYPKIKQLSANLAAGLLALWRDHRVAVPPTFATADRLATLLEPGVAAFLGQLMMLAPDQPMACRPSSTATLPIRP